MIFFFFSQCHYCSYDGPYTLLETDKAFFYNDLVFNDHVMADIFEFAGKNLPEQTDVTEFLDHNFAS
jgi:hypothetical protein